MSTRAFYRWLVCFLVFLLTFEPLLAFPPSPLVVAGRGASDSLSTDFQRYARGDISLSEYEDIRSKNNQRLREGIRACAALPDDPSSPDCSPARLPEQPDLGSLQAAAGDVPSKDTNRSTISKIADWIKKIPKRSLRRRPKASPYFKSIEEAQAYEDEARVKPYSGNAAQREADSGIWRPIRVTARGEADQMQSVAERLIAFGGISILLKAGKGDRGAARIVEQGRKVLARLTPAQRGRLAASLGSSNIGRLMQQAGSSSRSLLNRIVRDKAGNNMVLIGAASALVYFFLNDGLDLDGLKDHLVALNQVEGRRSVAERTLVTPIAAVSYYHANNAASRLFSRLYDKARHSSAIGAFIKGAEHRVNGLGRALVKHPPAELAAKAKRFGDSARALGLPGISAVEQLSFKALAENAFKGAGLGLAFMFGLDSLWDLTVGLEDGVYVHGRRDKLFARYHGLPYYYFQKTGNKFKDAIEERKTAIANRVDGYRKFPVMRFLQGFSMFMGGYAGAVFASCIAPVTGGLSFALSLMLSAVVSQGGVAFGKWVGAKIDTSETFYNLQRKSNAAKILKASPAVEFAPEQRRELLSSIRSLDSLRRRFGIKRRRDLKMLKKRNPAQWKKLVSASRHYLDARRAYRDAVVTRVIDRAGDFEKISRQSQSNRNLLFVRSFDDVSLVKEGDYIKMVIDEGSGVPFRKNASPRYDIISLDGRRGIWDPETNRIIDCGKVSENNGLRILFCDDKEVSVGADGKLGIPEGSRLGVTKAGVVYEKSPTNKEWIVKGYGAEYDIVLRQSGRRFTWDGKSYVLARPAGRGKGKDKQGESLARLKRKLLSRFKVKDGDEVLQALSDLAALARTNGKDTAQRLRLMALR